MLFRDVGPEKWCFVTSFASIADGVMKMTTRTKLRGKFSSGAGRKTDLYGETEDFDELVRREVGSAGT